MIKLIYESNGTHKGKTIYCPVNGWNCPYCDETIFVTLTTRLKNVMTSLVFFESWEEGEAL